MFSPIDDSFGVCLTYVFDKLLDCLVVFASGIGHVLAQFDDAGRDVRSAFYHRVEYLPDDLAVFKTVLILQAIFVGLVSRRSGKVKLPNIFVVAAHWNWEDRRIAWDSLRVEPSMILKHFMEVGGGVETNVVFGLLDVDAVVPFDKSLVFDRDREFGVDLCNDVVGVLRVSCGDGEIVDLAKK